MSTINKNVHDCKDIINCLDSKFNNSFRYLNEYQKQAVLSEDKILLINAQVGSGKTTVLIHRILYLFYVKKIPLEDIVVLTFTNKAADEIKNRIKKLDPEIKSEQMQYFGTFHRVARLLLTNVLEVEKLGYTKDFSVIDEDELAELHNQIIKENNLLIKYSNRLEKRIEDYKKDKSNDRMKIKDDIGLLVELAKEERIKNNVMDFNDLIENAVKLLKYSNFSPDHIIIDEFQDSDELQLNLIDLIHKEKSHIFAVGDPNQLIYAWRGSKTNLFQKFQEEYKTTEMTLPINYRSTSTILDAAKIFLYDKKPLEGIRDIGNPIVIKNHHDGFNEAIYLADKIEEIIATGTRYNEIGIFYRKQKQSDIFQNVFNERNIPYEVSLRKKARDIPSLYWFLKVLKASINTNDQNSLLYVLCDIKFGPGLSNKKAKQILKSSKDEDIDLLRKIREFEQWSKTQSDNLQSLSEKMKEYFDLNSYLSPTSITYQEDVKYIDDIIKKIEEYILNKSLTLFDGIKEFLNDSSLYGIQILEELLNLEEDSVKLMTLHASKGLEFKYVFISCVNEGSLPLKYKDLDEEEEKRLFFVGITRAKDYLEISYHSNPEDYRISGSPSRYISMISDSLIVSDDIKTKEVDLSLLRKEVANLISENKEQDVKETEKPKKQRIYHNKYGEGCIISETDIEVTALFNDYGEKVFSKMFCPLVFMDDKYVK